MAAHVRGRRRGASLVRLLAAAQVTPIGRDRPARCDRRPSGDRTRRSPVLPITADLLQRVQTSRTRLLAVAEMPAIPGLGAAARRGRRRSLRRRGSLRFPLRRLGCDVFRRYGVLEPTGAGDASPASGPRLRGLLLRSWRGLWYLRCRAGGRVVDIYATTQAPAFGRRSSTPDLLVVNLVVDGPGQAQRGDSAMGTHRSGLGCHSTCGQEHVASRAAHSASDAQVVSGRSLRRVMVISDPREALG